MPEQAADGERNNAEIWSTRIQRELLALTTDNADPGSTDEVRSMIPSFVVVKEHTLDIAKGICIVEFAVEIAVKLAPRSEVLNVVVIKLDASMPKRVDGSVDSGSPCYPFTVPIAIVASGAGCFPSGSTIRDGDQVSIDLDWTPSLHLTDTVMNISLKVKESILQEEPFHPSVRRPEIDPVDELSKNARKFANSLSQSATNLTKGARSSFSQALHSGKTGGKGSGKKKTQSRSKKSTAKTAGDVKIGDEINMLEEPWVEARGVYSCKAIRRPTFVADAIEIGAKHHDHKSFTSPTSMFRSFTKSARSVLEESFLMITDSHIIELKASKLNLSSGQVVFCIPIEMMAKLKFRRKESLSLFFKPALDEPLIYMCPDSGDAVHQIQSVLKRHGVRGKHTNAAAYRAINEAMQLVQEIQTKELALKHDPTVDRVNEIMDLYRQAAERFEGAGDLRHEEVVTHMRKFLACPLAVSILDGSHKKTTRPAEESPKTESGVPEGEVLERSHALIQADDLDTSSSKEHEKASDKAFEENMDNLLKEAKEDFEMFKLDGDSTTVGTAADSEDDLGLADVAADLDAMMREADKELAELMKS